MPFVTATPEQEHDLRARLRLGAVLQDYYRVYARSHEFTDQAREVWHRRLEMSRTRRGYRQGRPPADSARTGAWRDLIGSPR